MIASEFEALKSMMEPCTRYRTHIGDDGHVIEVAVRENSWVYYAVELDRNDKFVANRPDHPFSQGIIATTVVHS